MSKNKTQRREKVRIGIRSKISGTASRPRLAVYRSNTAIYAQLIDDDKGITLMSASSRELEGSPKNYNLEISKRVGALIGDKAKQASIEAVVFDRSGYLFHGNVKALAEGAREAGLKF
jgi:large subunit ribosomal protein L18